jgi:DNA ligase (NAD+)
MEYHQDLPVLFTQMSVASLRAEWSKADAAYRAGSPLMSDENFDQLEAQLRSVAPYAPELQGPGGGSELLSLNHEIFRDWRYRLPAGIAFVVEPKIDGCAVALRYVKGRLAAAWTRSGRSAMPAIDLVKSVPRRIKAPGTVQVNGELYGVGVEKSQQNAAKSLNKTPNGDGLAFMAYTLVDAQGDELASLQTMSKWKFIVPDVLICTRDSEVMALHRRWENGDLFQSLPTDGIVVKVLSHDLQRELGVTPKYPCWALAMKK